MQFSKELDFHFQNTTKTSKFWTCNISKYLRNKINKFLNGIFLLVLKDFTFHCLQYVHIKQFLHIIHMPYAERKYIPYSVHIQERNQKSKYHPTVPLKGLGHEI